MRCLAQFVVRWSRAVGAALALLGAACLLVPLSDRFPAFGDPQLGFQTRGTAISDRLVAWDNLQEADRRSGSLTANPRELAQELEARRARKHNATRKAPARSLKGKGSRRNRNRAEGRMVDEPSHFCGPPSALYSRVVLASTDGSDLLSPGSVAAACSIQERLVRLGPFAASCEAWPNGTCCPPISVASYVAALSGRSSCGNVTEQDISKATAVLFECQRNRSTADCEKQGIPPDLLDFLVDTEALNAIQAGGRVHLKNSIVFLPLAASTATMPFYEALQPSDLAAGHVQIVAMELGLKTSLFERHLISDLRYMLAGIGFVWVATWCYTESLLLTLTTATAVLFSLGISYALYVHAFRLDFFPFMNLLAVVVVVGIGTDDAFIFSKIWKEHSRGRRPLVDAVDHALLSMFATSATTSSAFFMSYVSSITAIRCFSIFAGTAVAVNFLLLVFWLPAGCALLDDVRWPAVAKCPRPEAGGCMARWASRCRRRLLGLVFVFRHVWVVVFGALAGLSLYAVAVEPRFQVPNSPRLQLLKKDHFFERYDLLYAPKFFFEQPHEADEAFLPLRFVWGVKPADTGNFLDPTSKGELVFDEAFDLAAEESQVWLLEFCRDVRRQPFYRSSMGPLLANCAVETLVRWMQRPCEDPVLGRSLRPCCEAAAFPYPRAVFDECLQEAAGELHESPRHVFAPGPAGPRFSRDGSGRLRALVVEYDSNRSYTTSYEPMASWFAEVDGWTRERVKSAPKGLSGGWFVSHLDFLDLQRALIRSTYVTGAVCSAAGFAFLLLTTRSASASALAILSIACSLLATMAVLLALGWQLGVLEAIALCTSAGLAVDFCLHFGVGHRFADGSRVQKARDALDAVAGPTALAAITSAAAGVSMLASSVLAYVQIGQFLLVVTTVGWLYSALFFCALLSLAGPGGPPQRPPRQDLELQALPPLLPPDT